MLSAIIEYNNYSEEYIGYMLSYLRHSDAPVYSPVVKQIKQMNAQITDPRPIRKLTALADYEGKTRVIAIGDLLSNILLRPCHDKLMSCLKGMSPDYTHKQHTLHEFKLNEDEQPVSVDLTAATDRIPAVITRTIIGEYFADQKFSESWYNLMVKFQFRYSVRNSQQRNPGRTRQRIQNHLSYSTGQPMGLYSS
jgi:hypothetical protein